MPFACNDLRQALAECLAKSPCMCEQGYSARECIRPPLVNMEESVPHTCRSLLHAYGNCRRNWIDMRKRFRGRPSPTSSIHGASSASHVEQPQPGTYGPSSSTGYEPRR